MASKKKSAARKKLFRRVGVKWKTMAIGKVQYRGSYDGAKSNVCRANRNYFPKHWRTITDTHGVTWVERLPDLTP